MKKRIFAVLFATMMLAGCGGDDHAGHNHDKDHAEEQKQEVEVEQELDETSAYLQGLPKLITVDDAVAEDFFVIQDGVTSNQEAWDAFAAAVEKGEEAEVVVCQFTMKGGTVLDHLKYTADGNFVVTSDTSRDGYNDEKSKLKAAETYTEMKRFENFSLQEGGTAYTVCVLSDNPELTADDFRAEWINMTAEENHIYMLFVI